MTFLHLSFKNLSCTFCVIFVVFCLCLRCNFVNFRGWHLQIAVCFSSLTSSETSLSITPPCYLCCYVPDGLYPLKPRLRFRFLGYIRRLSKKQNKKRERTPGILQTGWWRDTCFFENFRSPTNEGFWLARFEFLIDASLSPPLPPTSLFRVRPISCWKRLLRRLGAKHWSLRQYWSISFSLIVWFEALWSHANSDRKHPAFSAIVTTQTVQNIVNNVYMKRSYKNAE